MTGTERIWVERQRQIDREGWTPEHDATHGNGELVEAAVMYARYGACDRFPANDPPAGWPWEVDAWKPCDHLRAMEKAGALIAAEIDRLLAKREQ